jgi:hypothetical protein
MAKLNWSKSASTRRAAKHGTSRVEGLGVAEEAARLLRMHEAMPAKTQGKRSRARRGEQNVVRNSAMAAAEEAARAEYQRMLAEAPRFTSEDIRVAEAEYRRMLDEGRAMRRDDASSDRPVDAPGKASKRKSRQPKFEVVRLKSRRPSTDG